MRAGNPCNPCNPGAATASNAGRIGWGRDYTTWEPTARYVLSRSHGNRLIVTYVTPAAAAEVYRHNAELARRQAQEGYESFPAGTQIVTESYLRDEQDGSPAEPGPVFFMRKERAGYDPDGNNWRYAFTRRDLTLIAEGSGGDVQFCKRCHAAVTDRDYVHAVER